MRYLPLILFCPSPWGTFGPGSSSVSRNGTDSTTGTAASTTIPKVVTTPFDAVPANPASPRTSLYPRSVSSPFNKASRSCLELRYPEATPGPSPLSKVTHETSSSGSLSSSRTPPFKVTQGTVLNLRRWSAASHPY
jgi:hypothetical protein